MESRFRAIEPVRTEDDSFEAAGFLIDAILMNGDVQGSHESGKVVGIEPVGIVRDANGEVVMITATQTSKDESTVESVKRILATT